MEAEASKIDEEKLRVFDNYFLWFLKAIGQRNKVECETEERKRKSKALHNLISEKKAELAR